MIRIVTDTGSDIPYLNASALGVESLELCVSFEEFPYEHREDTDFRVFYDLLARSKTLPTTSQVTPGQYLDVFEDAEKKGDEVLVITISGGISGTYSSAVMARRMNGYQGIRLVDSHQCSITQRMMVDYAVKLRDEGARLDDIEQALLDLRERLVFLVLLDTLTYLRKGGRIPPAMAILGEMLSMKPVVTMRGGKVVSLSKARGFEAGKRILWTQLEADGYDENWPVYFGYSKDKARGEAFAQETKEKYKLIEGPMISVGGVISTHAGPNAIGMGYVRK